MGIRNLIWSDDSRAKWAVSVKRFTYSKGWNSKLPISNTYIIGNCVTRNNFIGFFFRNMTAFFSYHKS